MRCAAVAAVVVLGLAVTGCASNAHSSSGDDAKAPSGPSSVSTWYGQGGTTLVRQIGTDLTAIGAAAPDAARMIPACRQLATDVTAARNYPQVPDGQAQAHWATALDELTATASDCTSGDTARADADIRKASLDMQQLNARVNELGNA